MLNLLKISTTTQSLAMATMNFSIPDDLKADFNRAFAGRNKSAVVAKLMRRAVAEAEQQRRREEAFRLLTEARNERPALDDASARQAREAGRP
jgi:metal-responsive CopG/Arc/MetJ family transcriptional regulator